MSKTAPATMRLDEIAAAWRAYDEVMLASGGEVTPDAEAELARLDLAERDKVDAYVAKIREIEARAKRFKELAEEATRKRKSADAEAERLTDRVALFMAERQVDALSGEIWRFQYENNGGLVPVELTVESSAPAFPGRFLKPPPPPPAPVVDTDALRQALKLNDPEALTVARLVPGRHLQIR